MLYQTVIYHMVNYQMVKFKDEYVLQEKSKTAKELSNLSNSQKRLLICIGNIVFYPDD